MIRKHLSIWGATSTFQKWTNFFFFFFFKKYRRTAKVHGKLSSKHVLIWIVCGRQWEKTKIQQLPAGLVVVADGSRMQRVLSCHHFWQLKSKAAPPWLTARTDVEPEQVGADFIKMKTFSEKWSQSRQSRVDSSLSGVYLQAPDKYCF